IRGVRSADAGRDRCSAPRPRSNRRALALSGHIGTALARWKTKASTIGISGLTHAASAPVLLRFAYRLATHTQAALPAGWLAFTGKVSNPLDHYERFPITWSSPFPVILTLPSSPLSAGRRVFPGPSR